MKPQAALSKTHVLVDHLTRNVTAEHLREIFGVYGRVGRIHLPINPMTGMGRGFAFIEYLHDDDEDLDKNGNVDSLERVELSGPERAALAAAKHMHGGQIDGGIIGVEVCEPPRTHREP